MLNIFQEFLKILKLPVGNFLLQTHLVFIPPQVQVITLKEYVLKGLLDPKLRLIDTVGLADVPLFFNINKVIY